MKEALQVNVIFQGCLAEGMEPRCTAAETRSSRSDQMKQAADKIVLRCYRVMYWCMKWCAGRAGCTTVSAVPLLETRLQTLARSAQQRIRELMVPQARQDQVYARRAIQAHLHPLVICPFL